MKSVYFHSTNCEVHLFLWYWLGRIKWPAKSFEALLPDPALASLRLHLPLAVQVRTHVFVKSPFIFAVLIITSIHFHGTDHEGRSFSWH